MPENQLSEQILHQEFWENRWLEAKAGSTIYSRLDNRQKWIEYWNSISGSYSRHMCCERNIANSIIELMRYEGIIGKESAVLDIGCGPGTFALPMSPSVSSIVALDPAEMMLDLLLQEAKQKSLTNISPVCTTWEDTDYSKDFDLVLAAFSTCINEADMLKKMNEASRKYACLIGFFKTEEKVLRDELWREIMGT
ncbi:MAG TPA: class I SAM-dependent methyltransferase, partial [Candidatus Bathyarchaeia archaeon]|nr:class I SAM-dependent methyltransferase [Candidatus Bathyarchaeia archaeon]